jgi:hypothetical protein
MSKAGALDIDLVDSIRRFSFSHDLVLKHSGE